MSYSNRHPSSQARRLDNNEEVDDDSEGDLHTEETEGPDHDSHRTIAGIANQTSIASYKSGMNNQHALPKSVITEDSPNVHNDEENKPNQSFIKERIITVSRVSCYKPHSIFL